MNNKYKLTSKGNTIAVAGGLCTIVSLTIIEEQNLKIIMAGLGVIFAAYGVYLISKAEKNNI